MHCNNPYNHLQQFLPGTHKKYNTNIRLFNNEKN